MDTTKSKSGARPQTKCVHKLKTAARPSYSLSKAAAVKSDVRLERIKLNYARVLASLFCLALSGFFISCSPPERFQERLNSAPDSPSGLQPLSLDKTERITVKIPDWPDDSDYPPLLGWEVIITDLQEQKRQLLSQDEKEISVTVQKDYPVSILIYPVTEPMFFSPAGIIYPLLQEEYEATWPGGICATALKDLLLTKDDDIYAAVKYFNWQKLYESLLSKDQSSFEKYDSLSGKKCTASYNVDFTTLHERIITPPSRFTVPYFDTKSYERSKISGIDADAVLLSEYIPLNEFDKEKGCITVQITPKDHKAAFLSEGKIIYLQKNKAYPLKE